MIPQQEIEIRNRYEELLKPLFFPDDPIGKDIVNYLASLLRIVGMEDGGWDPYLESRAIVDDLYSLFDFELPTSKFSNPQLTKWRLALLFYSHIVEMDAPYEVIMNLLRIKLGKYYSPNPFFDFLTPNEQKNYAKKGLYPKDKIRLIKQLSSEAGLGIGEIFDEFYNSKLRNAISHADYIFAGNEFRCRNGTGSVGAFRISIDELNDIILKAKLFLFTFFQLERAARKHLGQLKNKALPYDQHYKGLMEILVDDEDVMCGFKVYWPNYSTSTYRRSEEGCEMTNCMLGRHLRVELMVGLYARNPGDFSPLVETGHSPRYMPLEGTGMKPDWPST